MVITTTITIVNLDQLLLLVMEHGTIIREVRLDWTNLNQHYYFIIYFELATYVVTDS